MYWNYILLGEKGLTNQGMGQPPPSMQQPFKQLFFTDVFPKSMICFRPYGFGAWGFGSAGFGYNTMVSSPNLVYGGYHYAGWFPPCHLLFLCMSFCICGWRMSSPEIHIMLKSSFFNPSLSCQFSPYFLTRRIEYMHHDISMLSLGFNKDDIWLWPYKL